MTSTNRIQNLLHVKWDSGNNIQNTITKNTNTKKPLAGCRDELQKTLKRYDYSKQKRQLSKKWQLSDNYPVVRCSYPK